MVKEISGSLVVCGSRGLAEYKKTEKKLFFGLIIFGGKSKKAKTVNCFCDMFV